MAGFQVESDRIEQAAVSVAETLGIPSLKEQQIEAFVSFASRKDTFVSLPTGYCKSIIRFVARK